MALGPPPVGLGSQLSFHTTSVVLLLDVYAK